MHKDRRFCLIVVFVLMFCVSVSGCAGLPSLNSSTSGNSGTVQSAESSPISSTPGVVITRTGSTISATGNNLYNTYSKNDPFLLKAGSANVTVDLQGGGFIGSIGLNYKRPGSKYYDLVKVYEMDSSRTMQTTKTIMLPYTGDYYLTVNWADSWAVTIDQ